MKKKQSIEQLKEEGFVTTADKIPENVYDGKKNNKFHLDEVGQYEVPTFTKEELENIFKRQIWISEIEAYCGELGILPIDLILCHKEARKPKKGTKTPKTEEIGSTEAGSAKNNRSNWFKDYKKAKTGISE